MAGEIVQEKDSDDNMMLNISAIMHVAIANVFSAFNIMSKDTYSKQLMAEVYDGTN